MDLYEFAEAEQARLLWQDDWSKQKKELKGGMTCG